MNAILVIGIYFIFFNSPFYNTEFKKYDVLDNLEISQKDLDKVKNNLIGYFSLTKKTLQTEVMKNGNKIMFYENDEIMHMENVRQFFIFFLVVLLISMIGIIITTVLLYRNLRNHLYLRNFAKSLIVTPIIYLSAIVVIVIMLIFSWEYVFDVFHEIFFSGGNYVFYGTSNMMIMLPEEIFFDGGLAIGITWLLMMGGTITSGIYIKRRLAQWKF